MLVSADEELHFGQGGGHETDIVCKASGGQVGVVHRHTHVLSRSPPMEGLEEEVEEVGTGGATLSQPIGHRPLTPIHLAVAEAVVEVGVEMAEALNHR
jgi:hypothetical protein